MRRGFTEIPIPSSAVICFNASHVLAPSYLSRGEQLAVDEQVPPSREALNEALALSTEILRNLELSEMPLSNIALKVGRLARLLNDFEMQRILKYETRGYPCEPAGIQPEIYQLAVAAGREFTEEEAGTKQPVKRIYTEPIEKLEAVFRVGEASLAAAADPDVSITANHYPFANPFSNVFERAAVRENIYTTSKKLASRRALLHDYTLRRNYELRFSGIAEDVFARIRERVDKTIGTTIPEAAQRFAAVHENLRSENPEDWSNAVHSCRRILKDLADTVFPPTAQQREALVDGKPRSVRLGEENYINRIMAYVEDSSTSPTFVEIVGSHLAFLGDRLDSIVGAAHKGSHETIVRREDADRCVVYTYMVVGDILSLRQPPPS
jgi:hypothetical protein